MSGRDFNDMAREDGGEAVRRALEEAQPALQQEPTIDDGDKSEDELADLLVPGVEDGDNPEGNADKDDFKPHFELHPAGVFFLTKKGGKVEEKWICTPLKVEACTRDTNGNEWGRLLTWRDPDGRCHQWAMPMAMLAGDGGEFRSELMRGGVELASGKTKFLVADYVQHERVKARALCVDRTGWHGARFVLPDSSIGDGGEPVIFQSVSAAQTAMACSGTPESWRDSVARRSAGNSRMMFAIACAFAAPLLELAGEDGGGFHLSGSSSSGKTTALEVAASVYGPPKSYVRKWRATANGLEGVATLHNDLLLVLDEISQADAKEAGDTVYMLANGTGKQRASRDGSARASKLWRLLWLSAGECGLSDHMRTGGKRAMAGQEVRLANIPADAGKGFGAFDTLNGAADGADLSRFLKEAAAHHHGSVGRAFLAALINRRKQLTADLKQLRAEFVTEHLPPGAEGQVARVLSRFALVAVAGEFATLFGLTGWRKGDANKAAATCFKAWLSERGGAGNAEDAAILAQVRGFFEAHGASRFEDLDNRDSQKIINRAGYVRDVDGQTQYIVLPESFKRDVVAGFNPATALKTLLDAGWLVPDQDGKPQMRVRLPDTGRTRCYVFRAVALGDAG